MLFEGLKTPSPDPILGMAARFNADPAPDKVDMGIGVYMDDQGRSPVLESVKQAEALLLKEQSSKAYLSSAGHEAYNRHIRALLLGDDHPALPRARTIQTPGGTGALRVAADFLHALKGDCRVWIPDPTWANHRGLFAAAGHEVTTYRYLDAATGGVAFGLMMEDLAQIGPGDIVIVHGCCQNPTGADLTAAQWTEVSDRLLARGAVPLVDIAYQGFGRGLDEDAAGLRLLAETQPELLIASSCSKNFALYRERVGALTLVSQSTASADRALGHLLPVVRANYSMPPDHGAAVVAQILGDPELRALWVEEVTLMRERLIGVRAALAGAMNQTGGRDYGFIARNRGMFVQLDLTPEQVDYLREHEHIHLSRSGRMNVAGLNRGNVARVGAAVGRILSGASHG
ncbi:aromatic amino acid transaminase [Pararhodobacter aggregans]|nr:amino acid aminotransferase [Pararhodobacter aggregans]PTX03521.1 aspartate aminotransferase [Pararhodobacter aggregans]